MINILKIPLLSAVFYVLLLNAGCNVGKSGKVIEQIFKPPTPYEQYAKQLEKAGLTESGIGRQWIERGEEVMSDSLVVVLPHLEEGYFAAEKVSASSVRFSVQRGEKITVALDFISPSAVKLFIDVFALNDDKPIALHSGEFEGIFEIEVTENQQYLVRLQPELLQSVRYKLTITASPQLVFPVEGKGNSSIRSLYGEPRDGGKRKHEGIDIFAAKGTPVLAVADGIIAGVNENRLGGKVIWHRDQKRGLTYYYAHLDEQLVKLGQSVKAGEIIGSVGNTGNAEKTPPHLHLGFYGFGSSIDPLQYVFIRNENPPAVISTKFLGEQGRVSAKNAELKVSPVKKSATIKKLTRHTPVEVKSSVAGFYKIRLPDNTTGFVAINIVEELKPVRKIKVKVGGQPLYEKAAIDAVVKEALGKEELLSVLAEFEDYLYVETSGGARGWILI